MRDCEQKATEGTENGLSGVFVPSVSFCSRRSSTAFEQAWGLDKAGNWSTFDQDDQGNGAWDLEQTRATNKGNEVVGIGAKVGPVWTTPAYDPPGNMVSFPKPDAPTESFAAVYDAWNRLVTVLDGEAVVAAYAYDGRSYRVRKTVGGQDRHYFYNSNWQLLEERMATPTPADLRRQYVWGIGVNSLVLRGRDADNDGVLDERLYVLQDSHWDVCAVIDDAGGTVKERYEYQAYGNARVLDPVFEERAASVCAWAVLFQGAARDAETGLYHVRYRYIHPEIGTWITRDPLYDHWMRNLAWNGDRSARTGTTTCIQPFACGESEHVQQRGYRSTSDIQDMGWGYRFLQNAPFNYCDSLGLSASLCGQRCCCTEPTSLDQIRIIENPGRWLSLWPALEVVWDGKCFEEVRFKWYTCIRRGAPQNPECQEWGWVEPENDWGPRIGAGGGPMIVNVKFYFLLCKGVAGSSQGVWTRYRINVPSQWWRRWGFLWWYMDPSLGISRSQSDAVEVDCEGDLFRPFK